MTNAPHTPAKASTTVIVGALVAFGCLATAAVLFVTGDASTERLGLLFAMFGAIIAGLIAALRADHAATQTNVASDIATALDGGFEERVANAVDRVLADRSHNDRASDPNTTRTGRPNRPIDRSRPGY